MAVTERKNFDFIRSLVIDLIDEVFEIEGKRGTKSCLISCIKVSYVVCSEVQIKLYLSQ